MTTPHVYYPSQQQLGALRWLHHIGGVAELNGGHVMEPGGGMRSQFFADEWLALFVEGMVERHVGPEETDKPAIRIAPAGLRRIGLLD